MIISTFYYLKDVISASKNCMQFTYMNKDQMKRKIETSKLTNEEINIKNNILSDILKGNIFQQ